MANMRLISRDAGPIGDNCFAAALMAAPVSTASSKCSARFPRRRAAICSANLLMTSELLCQFCGLLFAGFDHIDRTAIPRMFERKRHDFPNADESQPEFDISAQILEPVTGAVNPRIDGEAGAGE